MSNASPQTIWHSPFTLDELNALSPGTLIERLGIVFTEVGPDYLSASMPVDARTIQPRGLLHGGASVSLAEGMGSTGAAMCVDRERYAVVGLEINANHVRGMRVGDGPVHAIARPLHRGRTTQIWQTEIRDPQERLVCVSRLTVAVLPVQS
jgi:1,4-dihydroxy-2-naphthoyl-CoA hydrolase